MTFRTILTHVVADRGCAARLQMAREVAKRFSARLIGLGAQAPWPFSDATHGSGGDFARIVEAARSDVAAAAKAFEEGCADKTVESGWRAEIAYPNTAMARHARVADLIVAYRPSGMANLASFVAPDMLLMEAGVPVLLLPTRSRPFRAETVLLAWKNTREARRAISTTMPLLTSASRVLVAAVCEGGQLGDVEAELRDVVDRLSRNGVKATSLAEVGGPGTAGRRLLRIAQTEDSDVIVAGGYGHSRLREWILGGVTKDLIADGRRYVLLSH